MSRCPPLLFCYSSPLTRAIPYVYGHTGHFLMLAACVSKLIWDITLKWLLLKLSGILVWKGLKTQIVLFAVTNLSILKYSPSLTVWRLQWCLFFGFVPYSFFLSSPSSSSAAQPHSHSSSLSSVELFSASDDIHRFSAQVLYVVNSGHLCLQRHANTQCRGRKHK